MAKPIDTPTSAINHGEVHQKRLQAVRYAFQWVGTPYHWGTEHGGDDFAGMDCSGFFSEIVQSVGIARQGMRTTADGWYRWLIERGAIVKQDCGMGYAQFHLSQNGHAYHVMFGIDEHLVIGASGGTSDVTNDDEAADANAFVKMRPKDYVPESLKRQIVYIDPFTLLY